MSRPRYEESGVIVGGTLLWPMVTVLGFLALTGVVVALGASATARYEFERNGAREPKRAAVPAGSRAHPAGSRTPARQAGATEAAAVGVAVRPVVTPVVEHGAGTGWWLVGESEDGDRLLRVAGPFRERVDADWAALANGLRACPLYGAIRADGALVPRTSPEERAWLSELGDQLDRLPEDWDALLSDTDPLTTLVVEVAAALVEAGLPLLDCAGDGAGGGGCLTPERARCGVLVSWQQHERMSRQQVRGAAADATVQQTMN